MCTVVSNENDTPSAKFVSVIIAGRNEAHHLPELIQALKNQSHSFFECIYVNDHSTDETTQIFENLTQKDNRFRLLTVNSAKARKKEALKQGIKQAKYERLVFTDADCIPPPDWLVEICKADALDAKAVWVGYSPVVQKNDGFQSYETAFTAWKTASAIGLGYAYMAVGRNLSYPKTLFTNIGGFDERLLSGDDDLLVQQARKFAPIYYLNAKASFVPTQAQPNLSAFIRQKQRHFSTGKVYDRKPQLLIAFFHLLHFLVLISPFFIGWNGLLIVIMQHILGLWISFDMAKYFDQPQLFKWHNASRYGYLALQLASPLLGVLRKERW